MKADSTGTVARTDSMQRYRDIPSSLPVKPPRRPPRPPRSPLGPPPRASDGAVPDASRFPLRGTGLSATFVGGAGSLSESWSLSFPFQGGQLVGLNRLCWELVTKELVKVL